MCDFESITQLCDTVFSICLKRKQKAGDIIVSPLPASEAFLLRRDQQQLSARTPQCNHLEELNIDEQATPSTNQIRSSGGGTQASVGNFKAPRWWIQCAGQAEKHWVKWFHLSTSVWDYHYCPSLILAPVQREELTWLETTVPHKDKSEIQGISRKHLNVLNQFSLPEKYDP